MPLFVVKMSGFEKECSANLQLIRNKTREPDWNLYSVLYDYCLCIEAMEARVLTVIVTGNGHGDVSSNPG